MSQNCCGNVCGYCGPGSMLGAEDGQTVKTVLILKVLTSWLCNVLAFSECDLSIRE